MSGQFADNRGTNILKFELLTSPCVRESGLGESEAGMRLPDGKVDLATGSQYRPFRSARVAVEWALETLLTQALAASKPCLVRLQITKPVFAWSPVR